MGLWCCEDAMHGMVGHFMMIEPGGVLVMNVFLCRGGAGSHMFDCMLRMRMAITHLYVSMACCHTRHAG